MSYHRKALGLPPPFPQFPGGMPGPMPGPASPGFVGPPLGPSASLFPTTVRWGDVVNVMGPFAGKFQGSVVVKFQGAPAEAPALTSAYGGSVIVPEGAETGLCTIEMDGRQLFGTNCVVSPTGPNPQARPKELPDMKSWKNVQSYLSDFPDLLDPNHLLILGSAAFAAWWFLFRRKGQ